MGHIWVREFTGGLNTTRMPETTQGGVLIQAEDGHITRGGEFEKRASFVSAYALPADTFGLAYTRSGLVVFGSAVEPTMPSGVSYQRLEHPTGVELDSILSFDLFKGKIYVVGLFADGSRHHFYDGVRVSAWFDGRARATFQVTAGGYTAAIAAQGSFEITGGTVGGGNQITSVTVNSVTVTSGAVSFDTDNDTTAAAVAADITSNSTSPDYTAVAVGPVVYIAAVTAGAASNTFVVAATPGGTVTVGSETALAGGADEVTSSLTGITIDGIDIIYDSVVWTTSNADTAQDIADLINSTATSPEYSAVATEDTVIILAGASGEDENGKVVLVTVADGFAVSPASGIAMSGGATEEDTYDPGTFVRTIKSKMYSPSGPNMHFSGIQEPTGWTTDYVGAGFIDMSSNESGSEEVNALARYQDAVAVFSETVIQLWYVDPDPSLNRQTQVLNNTGTASPRSVTQFGDNDIYYLDESGLRSLRARDSSNAASTTDIGVPIDSLVTEAISALSDEERGRIYGLIEPREGRFWLIIGSEIFVLSYFSGAKVSAWSKYNTTDSDGETFSVDDAVVYRRRVFLRSGDTIYVFGGLGSTLEYDATQAIAQIPYLDGDKPWQEKHLAGFDAAGKGSWRVYAAMNPNNIEAQDVTAEFADTIADTTFGAGKLPLQGSTTHISLILKSQGSVYAKLGSLCIAYDADEDTK
jgi:hypothetical protein